MYKKEKSGYGTVITLAAVIFLVVALLVLSALSLITYRSELDDTLGDITKNELIRCTDQSILLFNSLIEDYFRQLDTISQFCSVNSEPGHESVKALIDRYNMPEGYARFGVSGTDGILYNGTEQLVDISGTDYFAAAMAGKRLISDVYWNTHNGKNVIVLAMPVEKDGQVAGVVCAQYDVQIFADLLGDSQFEGIGATMVMQQDGRMVSSYDGMENFDTFYQALEQMEFRGEDTLERFQERVQNGENGFLLYYRDGIVRYLHFKPAGISDYVMLSLIMGEALDENIDKIGTQALILTVRNVLIYCIILICIWGVCMLIRRLILFHRKDPLTQTFNKVSAQTVIDRYLRGPGRNRKHALLFLDIDNFKEINDQHGHGAGDHILVLISRGLKENFRDTDIISRFGGDEFLIFMKDIPGREVVESKAVRLSQLLSQAEIPITISAGIACYPKDGQQYSELLGQADEALYQAKHMGKNRFQFFSDMADSSNQTDVSGSLQETDIF